MVCVWVGSLSHGLFEHSSNWNTTPSPHLICHELPLLLHSGKNRLPMQQGTTIHSSPCKHAAEMRILTLRTPQMHYSGISFEVLSTHLGSLEPIIHVAGNDRTDIGHRVELVVCQFWCYRQVCIAAWYIWYSCLYMGSGKMITARI